MYFIIFLDTIWRPMQFSLKTTWIHDRSHISKLNDFATETNVQTLQHNYRENIIPYFRLIPPRTHKTIVQHTSHAHIIASLLHIQTHSAAYTPAHGGVVRTDKLTQCLPPMTGKNETCRQYKCNKTLNLLRSINSMEWGADSKTLIKTYVALIRSWIDYGSIIYNSAKLRKPKIDWNDVKRSNEDRKQMLQNYTYIEAPSDP